MNESVVFWIILAVVLGIIESVTFSLVSIWPAISAVFCAILAVSGVTNKIVAVCFIVFTAILLVSTRPFVKRYINTKVVPTNADRIIGAEADVVRTIYSNSPGQISVMGNIWTAFSVDSTEIAEGKKVVIISIEGVKAIVREI